MVQQWKEEEKNKERVLNDCCSASPVYDPTYKQDPLPHCGVKEKQALNPNHYPPKYVPEEEDAPLLVDNLIALPASPLKKEEDQGKEEEEKGENNNGNEMNREEDRRKDMDKTQADSGQEARKKRTIIQSIQTLIILIKFFRTKYDKFCNSVVI